MGVCSSLNQDYAFFGENTTEMMLCPPHGVIRRHMVSTCPFNVEANLGGLVKVISARFLCCNVTLFLFVTIFVIVFWEDTWR